MIFVLYETIKVLFSFVRCLESAAPDVALIHARYVLDKTPGPAEVGPG